MSSPPQHMEALKSGNVIRLERAQLRREIAALGYVEGLAKALEVIALPPPECGGMRVEQLLRAVHRFGPERARVTMLRARVSPLATLAALTLRQREALRSQLDRDQG